jgi:hypothetical protein
MAFPARLLAAAGRKSHQRSTTTFVPRLSTGWLCARPGIQRARYSSLVCSFSCSTLLSHVRRTHYQLTSTRIFLPSSARFALYDFTWSLFSKSATGSWSLALQNFTSIMDTLADLRRIRESRVMKLSWTSVMERSIKRWERHNDSIVIYLRRERRW